MEKSETKQDEDYVSRAEAVALLGVKADTLYSYVSRGLIRRLRHPNSRHSLYFKEDIDKIRTRSEARRSEGVVAAGAILYGGEPVIATSITEIAPAGQLYRGRLAVELAQQGTCFEAVAELLWSGIFIDESTVWKFDPPQCEFQTMTASMSKLGAGANIHELLSILTLSLGMSRGSLSDRVSRGITATSEGRQLIQALTGCFAFMSGKRAYRPFKEGESVAKAMARSLGISSSPQVLRVLNASFVLSADHELSPATFSARIAASGEADMHSCIASAICTHSGARIARACDHLEDVFSKMATKTHLVKNLLPSEKTSRAIPGFNHPLYPKGDPRANCLLQIIKENITVTKRLEGIYDFLDIAARQYQIYPRIEMAIVVMAVALGLPSRTAAGIYTLGRTAGWVAHVIEQRLTGYLIRPRAKFMSTGR
ncbi:MAG: citrate synthase [Candidimonas sp.]|nr:MAG: citrate synthase [Candidimonas sp.]TAM20987.1 MAG: citrate synthase [Candidimonas sp.]